jgi:hypothetical protein
MRRSDREFRFGALAIIVGMSPEAPDSPFRLQALAIWQRWRARRPAVRAAPPAVPDRAPLPPFAERHYRAFAWTVGEQRLFALLLAALGAACGLVWLAAEDLRTKPPVVVRAGPTLREAADAFYGVPEISYDQVVFFLHGCLPLLYEADEDAHPWLPLAEGLVAPEIYDAAERRLSSADVVRRRHHLAQSLTLAAVDRFVADPKLGRAAAEVRGELVVTPRDAAARRFPWRGIAVLAVNPGSRLNPYPFYLLSLDTRTGPGAARTPASP